MKELKLLSKHTQTDIIKTFRFENDGVEWVAGQNQGWDLGVDSDVEDDYSHWFTVSSAPSEGTVDLTTRISDSNYKQALDKLEQGDTISVHDMGGDFTWEDDEPVVMVAGGIGITPFRSILAERATKAKNMAAHLVYFNRDDQIAFREELDRLDEQYPEFQVTYVVGEPVTADKIVEVAPEAKERTTYLSGPEPMVESVGKDLRSNHKIEPKQDWFPGYDENSY